MKSVGLYIKEEFMSVTNVKGTHDILANESGCYSAIENLCKNVSDLFGYNEVRPPVLEHSELFIRGVGESSDIVRKEMYTFLDKGERSLTLRPEFTAGIARLIVQNKLYATNELPLKYYYCGPVFRYERPQLGRYRQFNQFGVESVGHDSPYNDLEVIVLAYSILQSLGLENVSIKLNTLGDDASREAYKTALKEYFAKYIDSMCEDCKQRFELNPLRILDCKVPDDIKIAKGAPRMSDYLSDDSKTRFETILKLLKGMSIPYEIDEGLVRGLDYYSETVFEFHYTSKTNQNYGAIGAGGHYGKLIKELDGPEIPGVGFSFGVERLFSVLQDDGILNVECSGLTAYVMPLGEKALKTALDVANCLRINGFRTDICFDANIKIGQMFKRAEKKGTKYAFILGETEIEKKSVIIKNMQTQEQFEVPLAKMIKHFEGLVNKGHHCHHDDGCCCSEDHHHSEDHECCCGHNHDKGHECCQGKHSEDK